MYSILYKILSPLISLITAISAAFAPAISLPLVPVNPNPIPDETISQSVTVMTFNIKSGGEDELSPESRKPLVRETVMKYTVDSFGVQEADKAWVDLLTDAMPEYAHVGKFRDDGIENGESSTVFYLKDKYDLVDSGDFWLSETPDIPSKGWDAPTHNRICTYVILKDKETGFTYAHFNTHLDNAGEQARAESVALIASEIAQLAPDIPVVLTGDFNFNETSYNYANMLSCGMKDTKYLAETADFGPTYHGYRAVNLDILPIDFVFVNAYVKSVAYSKIDRSKVNGIYPSDHYPVIVNMTLFN